MRRRRFLILAVALILILLVWQLPALLKAVPSRYVAAYLPEPLQALAEREHVEMLPTVETEIAVDTAALLGQPAQPATPLTPSLNATSHWSVNDRTRT